MNNANSNMRILIVDDEPEFQEAYKTLLNDAGYVAVASGSGKDALSKYWRKLKVYMEKKLR